MKSCRPFTGGADQDEEEDVDCEGVKDGYNGAFGDGDAWSLQLPFRHVEEEQTSECVTCTVIHSMRVKHMSSLILV